MSFIFPKSVFKKKKNGSFLLSQANKLEKTFKSDKSFNHYQYIFEGFDKKGSLQKRKRGVQNCQKKKLVTKYEYEMTKHKEAKEKYDSYQVTTRKIIKCFTLA